MSIEYTDLWQLIQDDICGVLQSDPFIGARPVLPVEPGDVQSVIDTKIAKSIGLGADGKSGVGCLVLPIEEATDEDENNPFGPLKLVITIQFVESVTINRGLVGTKKPVRIYAARAAKLLKLYTPVGLAQNLIPRKPVISQFPADETKSLRIGQVEFTASEADHTPLRRLDRPQLSVGGSAFPFTATVTQASAAAIFYTLDGSHPHARNPQAKLYSAPVSITEPCLFRARAFGMDSDMNTIGSDTSAFNFS